MFIDPFRLCVALLPLAGYALLLGLVNLWRRPLLTTAARDLAILAIGVGGLVMVGPLELFIPTAAAIHFGHYVWLLMLALYALAVVFLVLVARPRLTVYNTSREELRPILIEVVAGLDSQARWAGDSVVLPQLAIQLHIDCFPALRNVSLVASGQRQDLRGWQQLETALAGALRQLRTRPNPRGAALIVIALLIAAGCLGYVVAEPHALAEGWHDMLQH